MKHMLLCTVTVFTIILSFETVSCDFSWGLDYLTWDLLSYSPLYRDGFLTPWGDFYYMPDYYWGPPKASIPDPPDPPPTPVKKKAKKGKKPNRVRNKPAAGPKRRRKPAVEEEYEAEDAPRPRNKQRKQRKQRRRQRQLEKQRARN